MANLNHYPDTRKSQKSEKRLQIKETTYDDTFFNVKLRSAEQSTNKNICCTKYKGKI